MKTPAAFLLCLLSILHAPAAMLINSYRFASGGVTPGVFTFSVSDNGGGSASATTIATTSGKTIPAGSLVVINVNYEGSPTTITMSRSDAAADTFSSPGRVDNGGGSPSTQMFYVLSSISGSGITYTATFGAARTWRGITFECFTYTGTATFDQQSSSTAEGSTAVNSGNVTAAANCGLAVGGSYIEGAALTSLLINGSARDGTQTDGTLPNQIWYKIMSGTFTGAASGTASSTTDNRNIQILTFKSAL